MLSSFRRNNKTTIAELEEYYSGNKKKSRTNWLRAVLTLLVTVFLFVGVFFGSRLLYRTLNNSSGDKIAEVINTAPSDNAPNNVKVSEGVVTEQAATSTRTANDYKGKTANTESSADSSIPDTGAGEILFVVPILVIAVSYLYSRNHQLKKLK